MRARDLEILAFPSILDAIAALAVSAPGADACRALRPSRERGQVESALDRQWSFFRLVEVSGPAPLASFPDIREALAVASHDGATLSGERLVEVRNVLRQAESLQRFLRGRVGEHPALRDLPARLQSFPELEHALSRALDDDGTVRDDASPRLAALRAELRELRQEIEERLERLVTAGTPSEGIADRYVTVRNNRFVIPIKAGAAGRVAGVVQDRSASGETLFVEPLFAIDLNNRLLLLRKEEEAEELRLLALLTAQIGAVRHELGASCQALAEIDRLAAGAGFAARFHCVRPVLAEQRVDLRRARHPELLIAGHPVTPVDIRIGDDKRALVVTGPNTGGKTVALKTLGLLVLLAHAGILVPAEEGSTVPFVRDVFTDLADDQSIERSLSTFSSHVVNLVDVLRSLRPPCLVLLDEPGSGTDPEEGSALAIALIGHLIGAGALVMAATHYTPVKVYALNEPQVELAAAEVDPHTFEPRYRLVYGSLGESLGLAMARRLALPDSLLAAAEARRSQPARELSSAIATLETTRHRLEDERSAVADERRILADLERERAQLLGELRERRRARWSADLEESRAFLRQLKEEGRAVLDIARRRAPDAASKLAAFVRHATEEIARRAEQAALPGGAEHQPPAVGEEAEVRGTSIRGQLVEVAGSVARIQRGTMTFEVPLDQLRRRPPTAQPSPPSRQSHRAAEHGEVATEIRLVGFRVREALDELARFLDRAQGHGVRSVRIVHGLGSGALKRAIAEYLAGSPYCTGFHDAEPNAGGAGVTIVDLE